MQPSECTSRSYCSRNYKWSPEYKPISVSMYCAIFCHRKGLSWNKQMEIYSIYWDIIYLLLSGYPSLYTHSHIAWDFSLSQTYIFLFLCASELKKKPFQLEGGALLVLMSLWGWNSLMEQDECHTVGLVWEKMREAKGQLREETQTRGDFIKRTTRELTSRNRNRPQLVNLVPAP